MQRTLELEYDKLVIGSDLSALSYSYINKCPIIFLSVDKPYSYNENNNWTDLLTLWNDLAYLLSNDKYIPFSDKIVSIRLDDEKKIKIVTKQSLVATINYEKLIIANDSGLEGMPTPDKKTSYNNWVIDWLNATIGSVHNIDTIDNSNEDFVKKIYFYPSKRLYRNLIKKDLLCVSNINDFDLKKDEFDQSMVRLKILKMMNSYGIKGKWDKSQNRFIKPRIFSVKRDIYPLGKNIYNSLPNNISILYDSHEQILLNAKYDEKWHKLAKDRYLWNK